MVGKTRGLLAALLIASAALFATGVALEKAAESGEPAAVSGEASHSGEATHSESEEGHSDEGATPSAEESLPKVKETVLGIDIEHPLFVAAGVVLSLVLAALALTSSKRLVLVVIGLFALGFALLDAKELFHQLDEDRIGLAVLVGVIGALHLSAAGVAGQQTKTEETRP